MQAVSKMSVGSPIEKFKSVLCYTNFLAFCLLPIKRYSRKTTYQWTSNMPYIQSGTSLYMQQSSSTYSDPSTLRHEHSSTPNYSSFGLPFQQQSDLSVGQSA